MNNSQLLESQFEQGKIDLLKGTILSTTPAPLPDSFDFTRIEGMLLGLAVGDSLGNTSESMFPSMRRRSYGEIRDYLPNRHCHNKPIGLPSDDTQMACWLLELLLEYGVFEPQALAKCFCSQEIFGIGSTVSDFVRNYRSGKPFLECGVASAGNGALMRIAPIIIPHLKNPTSELWADTALCAALTHNDSGSTAACLAFVNILWQLLSFDSPPPPNWWLESYVAVARELEGAKSYIPRNFKLSEFRGPIWSFVEMFVRCAWEEEIPVLEACNEWYSGAFLLETVPSALYILMRHGADPEEAIIRAVNDTWDNDTVAAIVGAAVGALHGKSAIPKRWLDGLSGRTRKNDDGRIFSLLAEARVRFWE